MLEVGAEQAGAGWACRSCAAPNPGGTRFCGQCGTPAPADGDGHEQRIVTALFADISGFTALADTLDADALHRVIGPVIGLLAGIAERYGGTLAKYAGDAVLVFFGAPVAQEDHAQRALRCAGDMHRELAAALPRLPEQGRALELHVGVNSGRVVSGMFGGDVRHDYSILGDAVNVAQRLESVAPPGETYVGALTAQLAGEDFVLDPLGTLAVKGKAHGVLGWRLRGERGAAGARSRSVELVGRDRELAALRALVDGLLGGESAVLAVVAEPGAGKSRLTAELARTATERGVRWLEARALSYGASLPYWPVVDLLRRAYGITVDQDPEDGAAVLAAAPELARVPLAAPLFARLLGLPHDADDVEALSPEAFHRRLGDALCGWVSALADEGPLALLVEDLHWVDGSSLELLAQLARGLPGRPVLLAVTSRPEAEDVVERLGGPVAARLHLGPLDATATASIAAGLLGGDVDDELRDLLVERTSGNPFFVHELVLALSGGGSLRRAGDRWSLAPGYDTGRTPPTVEAVLGARLDQLPRPAAALLQTAAVVGRRLDLELLEAVHDDPVAVPLLVDQLVGAGLVDRARTGDREVLTISHALVVDVAYGRLVQERRRALHRRVAEAAEVLYGTADDVLDLLARHLYLAAAGVKAVDVLERAAARATRLYANEQAVLHLSRAVELVRPSARMTSRLPRLLLQVAELEELVGDHPAAERDYRDAHALSGDPRALRGLAAVLRKTGRAEEALVLLDGALATSPADPVPLWLEVVAVLAHEGRTGEALLAAQSGLAVAGEDTAERGHLLLRLARAMEDSGQLDVGLGHALEALELFERLGDLRGTAFALRVVGPFQRRLGREDEAVRTLRRGLAVAEQAGSSEEVLGCLINLGMALLAAGDLDEAAACDERAVRLVDASDNLAGQAIAHANLAEKLLLLGRLDDALVEGERGRDLAERMGAPWIVADALRTLALVQAARGDSRSAHQYAAQAEALLRSLGAQQQAEEVAPQVAARLRATA